MSEKSKMAESKGAKPKSDTVSKVFIFTPPRFEINTNTLSNQGNSVDILPSKLHSQFVFMAVYALCCTVKKCLYSTQPVCSFRQDFELPRFVARPKLRSLLL